MGKVNAATLILSIIGIIASLWVAGTLFREGKDLNTIVSAIGSVASLFGLVIAIIQLYGLRQITEATKRAVSDTRAQLILQISISDITRARKTIEQIQHHAKHNENSLTHLRLQDLRTILLQFSSDKRFVSLVDKHSYADLLSDIGIHTRNIYNTMIDKSKPIDVTVINQTLEDCSTLLTTLETQLKYSGGTSDATI